MKDEAFYLLCKTIVNGLTELSEVYMNIPLTNVDVQFKEGETVDMQKLVDMFKEENSRRLLEARLTEAQTQTEMRS